VGWRSRRRRTRRAGAAAEAGGHRIQAPTWLGATVRADVRLGSSSRSLSLHRLRLYHLKRSEGEASGLAGAGTQRQLQ
jgi:hypothetical protein